MRYHSSKVEFIRSVFGRIDGLTICFRVLLTFKKVFKFGFQNPGVLFQFLTRPDIHIPGFHISNPKKAIFWFTLIDPGYLIQNAHFVTHHFCGTKNASWQAWLTFDLHFHFFLRKSSPTKTFCSVIFLQPHTTAHRLDTVQDFLIKLGIKSRMHL